MGYLWGQVVYGVPVGESGRMCSASGDKTEYVMTTHKHNKTVSLSGNHHTIFTRGNPNTTFHGRYKLIACQTNGTN